MPLSRFLKRYGEYQEYELPDGTSFDDAVSLIQTGILGFCMCHNAEANLRYIRDGLRHIDTPYDSDREEFSTWLTQWTADGLRIFTTVLAREFFFYWADREELTQHGTGLPGSLTAKGRELLDDLNELFETLASASDGLTYQA